MTHDDPAPPTPPAIPAATLVVMRDRPGAPPELLIVERSTNMAFAAGMIVFPGGRVDPGDRALAAALGRPDAGAMIAAIRETVEETGIAVGLSPHPDPDQALALQAGLHAGDDFAALLAEAGLALDLAALTPFARWRPDHAPARRFDTWFFLAAAAPGGVAPHPQPGEIAAAFWASAADLLARIDAGELTAMFPTRRNLERIAQCASFDAARADAHAHPVKVIAPTIELRGGERHLCIPDDAGYPITSEPLAGAMRS